MTEDEKIMKTNCEYLNEFGVEMSIKIHKKVGTNDSGNSIIKGEVVRLKRHFKPDKYKNTCNEKKGSIIKLDEAWFKCLGEVTDFKSHKVRVEGNK